MLDNRELATLIVIGSVLVLLLILKSSRAPLLSAAKKLPIIFFENKVVVIIFSFFTVLTGVVIWNLALIKFWDVSLLKETVLTYFFISLPLIALGIEAKNNKQFWSGAFKSILGFGVFAGFYINAYSFNLFIEVIFQILALLAVFLMILGKKESRPKWIKLGSAILGGIGIFVLINSSLFFLLGEEEEKVQILKELIVSIIIPLGILPLVWVLALYSSYENFFKMLKIRSKRGKWDFEKTIKFIWFTHLNLTKINSLNNFYRSALLKETEDMKEFKEIIKHPENFNPDRG